MAKKKKILLLSDDMRMSSGIATMSKALVMGTVDKYDWFQVGAAINHPDKGKILDLSQDMQKRTGVEDASVKILPWTGYGNADLLRQVMNQENPDAILHFTDPRYWTWLYDMEHEIRENCPILYYTIWDDLPDPLYNRNYYESCDWLGAISRQTYGIVSRLTSRSDKSTWKPHADWQVSYVPHGINPDEFKPIEVPNDFKNKILAGKEYDFIFFWSNRNIRRKQPSDVIMAFKEFCDRIGEEKASKVALLMHTNPKDQNGTDLPVVAETLAPGCNVVFSTSKLSTDQLNQLYNMVDCTINIAGNEGFGLTTAESVMAGTPIIVNVTGGLQDQCGFKKKSDGEYFTAEDYKQIGSLHNWREWEDKVTWGKWATPIWSRVRTLTGSVPTPYIWDDKVDITELSEKIESVYNTSKEDLIENGLEGRRAFIEDMGLSSENMCQQLVNGVESTFENWKPRKRYELFKIA
jgi:glycosyltransferase involved in cell wall biosynthesis